MAPDLPERNPHDPDSVAGQAFTTVRRGYEPDEVRAFLLSVASSMRDTKLRYEDMERRLVEVERRAADPKDLDEHAVTQLLGEETARVLETARQAATDIRTRAEAAAAAREAEITERDRATREAADQYSEGVRSAADEADRRIRADADRYAEEVRSVADTETTAQRAAADEYDQRVRSAADTEVAELRASAAADAERLRSEAEVVLTERSAEAETAASAILSEADGYSSRVRSDADRYSEATRAAADSYRNDVHASADTYRADAVAEADRVKQEALDEARRIREEAVAAAEQRSAGAEAEAEAALDAAREQGRQMVEEARSYRERVIADLADRRRSARAHLDNLAATRDALAVAISDAASNLTTSHRMLHELEIDPGQLGDVASDRAHLEASDPVSEPGDDAADAEPTDEAAADTAAADAAAVEPAADGPEPAAEGTLADESVEVDDEPVVEEAVEAALEPELEGDGEETVSEVVAEEPVELTEAVTEDVAQPAEAEDAPADDQVVPVADVGGADTDVIDLTGESAEGTTAESSDQQPQEGGLAHDGSELDHREGRIDQIFARIRADRHDEPEAAAGNESDSPAAAVALAEDAAGDQAGAGSAGQPVANGASTLTAEPAAGDAASDADGAADSDPDTDLLDRRDAELVEIEKQLARKLKRVLADEQNETLDLLRRTKGTPTADTVLPGEADHQERYRSAALEDLAAAERAGASFFRDAPSRHADVFDVAGDFASEILRQIRSQLVRAFDDGGDEYELGDRIRSCYREWKTQRIAETARHFVMVAFCRGVAEAADDGDAFRWLMDDGDQPCPDCDDNQLGGAVRKGEPFPTGDLCPPAHPGCRCLAVPA